MKISLSINSEKYIDLAFDVTAAIVNQLDDNEQNIPVYSTLAEHSSSEVRSAIAYKSCLPRKIFKRLAEDSSIEVVKVIATNITALEMFDLHLIRNMIDRDVSIAITIANSLYAMNEEVRGEVIDYLMLHNDPQVLMIAQEYMQEQ